MMRTPFAASVLVILTACAAPEPQWVHPTVPQDLWQQDIAQCTRLARRASLSNLDQEAAVDSGLGGASTDMVGRARLLRQQSSSVSTLKSRCLFQRGYRQVKATDPDGSASPQ